MERLFTVVNQIYVHTIIDFMWAKIQNTCIQEIQSIQHNCYICPGRGTVTPQYTYLGSLEDVEALGVKLGRWSVGTERVVAASEGRRAVAVQGLGSIRTLSNRILPIRITLRRR